MKQPYLERQVAHHKHVLWLDIPVDYVLLMQNSKSPADRFTCPPDVCLLYKRPILSAALDKVAHQVALLSELHQYAKMNESVVVGFEKAVENLDEVPVLDFFEELRLFHYALLVLARHILAQTDFLQGKCGWYICLTC